MESWQSASAGDRELFDVISAMFAGSPDLVTFLFDSQRPELNASARDILAASQGFCSGDYLLIRAALDLWSGSGAVTVHEVLDADHDVSRLILMAMARLSGMTALVQTVGTIDLNSYGVKAGRP